MDKMLERKTNAKLRVSLRTYGTETLILLQKTYSDEAVGRMQSFEQHGCFKRGRASLENYELPGKPFANVTLGNMEKSHNLVVEER